MRALRGVILIGAICVLGVATLQARPNGRNNSAVTQESDEREGALLYCDSMSYDFGTVDRRLEDVWHTFRIENRGDEPLIITRVERSCSCMKVALSRRPIAPGESRDMRVTYELRKMPPGLFSKVVQIYSTTRDTGFSQFTITGRSVKGDKK